MKGRRLLFRSDSESDYESDYTIGSDEEYTSDDYEIGDDLSRAENYYDSEESEYDSDYDKMDRYKKAGLHFLVKKRTRSKKKRRNRASTSHVEPFLDVLLAQGSLVASNVFDIVYPALKELKKSQVNEKKELKDILRDLERIKGEVSAAKKEAEGYKLLLEECLNKHSIKYPLETNEELQRDLQNVEDAGSDMKRELIDIEEETTILGKNVLKTLKKKEKLNESIMEDIEDTMVTQIEKQDERINKNKIPSLDPEYTEDNPPPLPPRDRPPMEETLTKKDVHDIQLTTRDLLIATFENTFGKMKHLIEEEESHKTPEEIEEEKRREQLETKEWEEMFDISSKYYKSKNPIKASDFPINSRLLKMKKQRKATQRKQQSRPKHKHRKQKKHEKNTMPSENEIFW